MELCWDGGKLQYRDGDRSCGEDFTRSHYQAWYVVKLQFELEILQHLLTNIDLEFIWLSATC